MKRIKRRIIAISTALVMALALVVSFVPTDVKAEQYNYCFYIFNGELEMDLMERMPGDAFDIAQFQSDSELDTDNITGDISTRTVNIKGLVCDSFTARADSTTYGGTWTFVFEGENRANSQFSIGADSIIQVKPGGSLYTNELWISSNTTLTLNQTTADEVIPETPSIYSKNLGDVTFTPEIPITSISPTVTIPAGTKTFESEDQLMNYLTVEPEAGAHYTVADNNPFIVKTIDGDPYPYEDYPLTLEEGKEYYASVLLNANTDYVFSHTGTEPQVNITPQGEDISLGKALYADDGQLRFTVKFKVPKKDPTPPSPIPPTPTQHKFLNGDNQVVTYGQPVMFRLEGELSDYNGEGYIEVDGALVPAKYVAATKGSIILTLASDYVSGLKEGKHDVNIYFNDKSHVSTTFTLVKEETPTTTPTSTPNTTTKVTAPKTSDSVPFVVVGIVTLTVGIGSVVAYRKHACKGKASRFSYGDRSRK